MNNTVNEHDYKSGEGNKALSPVAVAIIGLLSIVSLGSALFGISNLSYADYCKEPQAHCEKNNPASMSTIPNIYRTLSNHAK